MHPFPALLLSSFHSVSGVPASNAQAVVNLLITSKKLFEYSGAANTFTALTPSASSTFRA